MATVRTPGDVMIDRRAATGGIGWQSVGGNGRQREELNLCFVKVNKVMADF